MSYRTGVIVTALLVALIALHALTAAAEDQGQRRVIREPVQHDVYLAARTVSVDAAVGGDVVAAGQSLNFSAPVAGDLIAAGEIVTVTGSVADDLRIAGRELSVASNIGDHMVAAGQSVTLRPSAVVGSFAWLAGETIRIDGSIGDDAKMAGQEVTVGGTIGGNAEIWAERIWVAAGTHIRGDLIWHSQKPPEISKDAVIDGQVIEKPLPEQMAERPPGIGGPIFLFLSVLLAGGVLYLLLPTVVTMTANEARKEPWWSLALGLIVIVVVPVLVLLLFVSAVGFLLGLMLIALFPVMVVLGYLLGLFVLASVLLNLLGKLESAGKWVWIGFFALALLLVYVLAFVPFGGLVVLLLTLLGIGALWRTWLPRREGTRS